MTDNQDARKPRTLTTRTAVQRQWAPPSLLPEPTPEPGYTFRWVRLEMLGKSDASNVSARFREGFEPVRAADHPELALHEVTDTRSKFVGCVESGGLLLCKIPTEFVQQRDAYYNNQTAQQMESVDAQLMSESDPRMPIFRERKTKVTFGTGN